MPVSSEQVGLAIIYFRRVSCKHKKGTTGNAYGESSEGISQQQVPTSIKQEAFHDKIRKMEG